MRPGVALATALATAACSAQPGEDPAAALHGRVCSAVVAAYWNGARPAAVEVEIPGPHPGDPAARVTLLAAQLPLAETCLGIKPHAAARAEPQPALPSAETAAPSASQSSTPPPSNPRPEPRPDPLGTRN